MSQFFLKRIFRKAGPPIHLIWFVTARCNLSCAHCFYHRQALEAKCELSFEEIAKTVSRLSPLLSVSLTGGEPFLREDLPEIAGLFARRDLTKNIVLFTNGYDTGRVLTAAEKILSLCKGINIHLGLSLDGFPKEHDEYRNKAGSYENAGKTIAGLKKIKRAYPNLNMGIGITLHKGNQNIIKELREDIYSRFGIHPGITLIRGNPRSPELLTVDVDIYRETISAIARDRIRAKANSVSGAIISAREALGQKLNYRAFIGKRRDYSCYAGSLMAVIYEAGDVFPCEMLNNRKLGNLRDYDYDLNKVWAFAAADAARKWIKLKKCSCTYECQYTCNILYNIRFLPRLGWYVLKIICPLKNIMVC